MDLSLMVMTKNGSWRLERMLRSIGQRASEIVIGVDAASGDDTACRARRCTPNVYRIDNPQGYIEPHLQTLFEKCSGDWVLRLDDDELMSTNFDPEALSPDVLDEYDLIGFPRAWVVNADPVHYIGTGRGRGELVPQFRMMRRSAEWSFVARIHTPGFAMKPAYVVPNVFIYHMNLLDQLPVDRRRKYEFYQSFRDAPWNRTYLLDPEELYRSGESLSCGHEMFPPRELISSIDIDYRNGREG